MGIPDPRRSASNEGGGVMAKKNGGWAFPRTVDSRIDDINGMLFPQFGMTVRQFYTGCALIGLAKYDPEKAAKEAIAVADATIEEESK